METPEHSLDGYIDRVTTLPPAPVVLPRLLQLLAQPEVDSRRVVEVMSYDSSLTAAVLRLCNSAFYGTSTPMSDLLEAVLRVGFDRVYELVVMVVGERAMRRAQPGYGIDEGELWKHSVATALAARTMAREVGAEAGVVFTAAILHDLGKIVLAQALEQSYARLIREIQVNQASLLEGEATLLGVQHAEIGGRLLERWNFPDELVAAVWNHHNPAAAIGHEQAASLVYLGNLVAHFMGFGYGHQALALRGRADALELTGLKARDLPRFMIGTFDQLQELERIVAVQS
jgi:putative nucleotidyltransferase with HDIG domain